VLALETDRFSSFLSKLREDIEFLKGVGPIKGKALRRLGIDVPGRLLFYKPARINHYPFLDDLRQGQLGSAYTCFIKILHVKTTRRSLVCEVCLASPQNPSLLTINTTPLKLIFFHGVGRLMDSLIPEETLYIQGVLGTFSDMLAMIHPGLFKTKDNCPPVFQTLYPTTRGLTQPVLRTLVQNLIESVPETLEWHSENWLQRRKWPKFKQALKQFHRPQCLAQVGERTPGGERLAFDAFLTQQLIFLGRRWRQRQALALMCKKGESRLSQHIRERFVVPLTAAQERALKDIQEDLERSFPMNRLVQGDVGSGKSIIAYLAAAQVLDSGGSIAIVAPTSILAQQHVKTLGKLLEDVDIPLTLLTGKTSGKRETLLRLQTLKPQVVVGTHALFYNNMALPPLALVIVDEEQRFGVRQRQSLIHDSKGSYKPHFLTLSATPIPRSYALTLWGDTDISRLTEMPKTRAGVSTYIIPDEKMAQAYKKIKVTLKEGGRIFWICPLITEGVEGSQKTPVELRFQDLEKRFPQQVGTLYGSLSEDTKQERLAQFERGELPILVTTTVIETGIDISNATLMVIEDANHFGLPQLHQLRGRVGRGMMPGVCIALYKPSLTPTAVRRLQSFRGTTSGFQITQQDHQLRGGGELTGIKQSGFMEFANAPHLLDQAHFAARKIISEDPHLTGPHKAYRLLLKTYQHLYAVHT
jgi:ATP-dependent DNA helicase RecG